MTIETIPFDVAEFLDTAEAQAEYLSIVFEEGDAARIAKALGTVARARGISQVSAETGLTRQGLYKALSDKGDPKLSTLLDVTRALGLRVSVSPIAAPDAG